MVQNKDESNTKCHQGGIYSLSKLDEDIIASCSVDKQIKVWNLRDYE